MRLIKMIFCKHKNAKVRESGYHFRNGGMIKVVFKRYLCPDCGKMWDEEVEI